MGANCGSQDETRKIRVMTLNYCGISNSPFQFYVSDYEAQLKSLGKKFEELIKGVPDFVDDKGKILLKDKMGKVEKEFKSNRHSPLFKLEAGFNTINMKGMSEKEFKAEWQKSYQKQEQTLRKKVQKLTKQQFDQQIEYIKTYDFLAYKAFVKYVYNQDLKDALKSNKSFSKYKRVLQPFYQFRFLDAFNKLSKFKYGYLKAIPDIFFVQDYSDTLYDFLQKSAKKNFFWFRDKDSCQMVILKKDAFGEREQKNFKHIDITDFCEITDMDKKNSDSVKNKILAVESQNFLIVSLYLTSRQKVNATQVQYVKKLLQRMNQSYQYKSKRKTVILGGDINRFIDRGYIPQGYDFYPQKAEDITTYKKRTALQVQIDKKDVIKKKSIDKIITNQKILHGEVTLIDGQSPDKDEKVDDYNGYQEEDKDKDDKGAGLKSKIKMLLPCNTHPFDQFVVRTDLLIPDYRAGQKILQGFTT